jgi:hypothetical protein
MNHLNNKQVIYCIFVFATSCYFADNLGEALFATFMLTIFASAIVIAYRTISFGIGSLFYKPTVKSTKAQSINEVPSERILKAEKAEVISREMRGEQLANIPAYARKEMGIGYPLNLNALKQRPTFTIKQCA